MFSTSNRRYLWWLVAPLLFMAELSYAEQVIAKEQEVVQTFTPPVPKKLDGPRYPTRKRRQGQEGWVELNYMISPEGRPYDITVISSTDSNFEHAAIKAAEKFEYEPAVLNGEPIDAGMQMRISFALVGPIGARSQFTARYKRLTKFLREQNDEQIEVTLAQLSDTSRNLYEEVYFQFARYQYLTYKQATPRARLDALNWASSFNVNDNYLPEDTVTRLMITRMSLEAQVNDLAAALQTGTQLLAREVSEEELTNINSVLAQIEEIRNTDRYFHVSKTIRDDNHSTHLLLKNSFGFEKVHGEIAELRLHCDKGRLGFVYQPDKVIQINPLWRDCTLILIGTPGTQFTIVEGA